MTGYRFDDVVIDDEAFRVLKGGRPVHLEPKAIELLLLLVRSPGRLVGKAEIQAAIWRGTAVTESALTRLVAQIRKSLGDDARGSRYVETVPTRGYRFVAALADAPRGGPGGERLAGAEPGGAEARISRRKVLTRTAAFATLLTGVAMSRRGSGRSPADAPSGSLQLQISSASGLNGYPCFSPDGGSVAFCAQRERSMEIVVRPPATGAREVAVTSDGGQNVEPAFSPDGRQLAYHSASRGGIWIVAALGGVPRQVTAFGSKPAWSPDGSEIAFQGQSWVGSSSEGWAAGEGSALWIVRVDDGVPRRVTPVGDVGPGGHGWPVWSPDGRRIAFVAGNHVCSVRPDGGDPRQTGRDTPVTELAWSADGRTQIWCGLAERANWVVWQVVVDPDTAEPIAAPRVLASGGEMASRWRQPALSRDSRWLAFTTLRTRYELLAQRLTGGAEPVGSPQPLVPGVAGRKFPAIFSPDGARVAFGLFRPGEGTSLWVAPLDGSNPRQLAASPQGLMPLLDWFPEGRRVGYLVGSRAGRELWSVDAETGASQRLRVFEAGAALFDMMSPRVAPDGSALLVQAPRDGVFNLWLLPIAGGEAIRLTDDVEGAGWPAWSPDGRQIAVELLRGGDTHVGVMPAEGGAPRLLTAAPGQSWPHSFSPDGSRIAFAGQREGIWNVYDVAVSGGPERRLTRYDTPGHQVRTPSWSPRGDLVAYQYGATEGTVWVTQLPQATLGP